MTMDIIYDTATRTLKIDANSPNPYGDTLTAKLDRHGQTIDLRGLSFGFTIETSDGEKTSIWPPKNVRYMRTNQDTIASINARWKPDESVTISAWVNRGDVHATASETFIAPRPPQPFTSWTWDNGWQPPVPYPHDGAAYNWDESTQSWQPAEDDAP